MCTVCAQAGAVAALLSFDASLFVRSRSYGTDWIEAAPGSTALHLAAIHGSEEICKLLLGAYVSAHPAWVLQVWLHLTANCGRAEACDLLLGARTRLHQDLPRCSVPRPHKAP